MKFEDLNLHEQLAKAINDLNFTALTPIQEQTIPAALNGRDITGLSQTGTGKTISFLIPVIDSILKQNLASPSVLILAPTRELVLQTQEEAEKLTKYTNIKATAIIGGTSYREQERDLEKKVDILIATPGRLIDYIKSETIKLDSITFLVLDEADRMFDMGFLRDVRFVMKKCIHLKQTMLFSATLSYYVIRLASDFLNNPVEVRIEPDKIAAENIEQRLIHLGETEKMPYLINMILQDQISGLGIIFTNYKIKVTEIVNTLRRYGIPITGISSLLNQKKRIQLLKEFKLGKFKYMVATDVASRGIDIENIDVVYNYNLPSETENYVHRIGRTARAGRYGRSISFCSEKDYQELEKIEKLLNVKIGVLEVKEELMNYPESLHNNEETEKVQTDRPNRRHRKDHQRNNKNKNLNKTQNPKEKFSDANKGQNSIPNPNPYKKNPYKQNSVVVEQQSQSNLEQPSLTNQKFNKKDFKQPNKFKNDKNKFSNQKKEQKINEEPKIQKVILPIEDKSYDKSKRNLFDINEIQKDSDGSQRSLWQKIKSFFGS